ncbi:hypothetical protein Q31b_42910 [Novipirellula aureliae]|uniref:Uncharacterized protein n=1 Tax=Novipirellula aureliae TaxID=2527966 RepID=A0A5C6DJE9_9BACT|nr:hypothetical protein [Novipirellula aureliae]TWU37503.1 hypothetical protein Q31b_42910 [Novipirellula aureliae]
MITYRNDAEKAKQDVESFGIRYTEIVLVSSFEQKAVEVVNRNISVYFDDQDEMLMDISEGRGVFKIRNGGNFCFDSRRWLYSQETGKQIC